MKLFTPLKAWLALVLVCLLVFSCKNDEEIVPERVLVSSELVIQRFSSELQLFLSIANLDMDLTVLTHDIDMYRVTYKTNYKGNEIIASALVSLPKNAPAAPIASFQHGTIAGYIQAPTALELSDNELILYQALASPGIIAVAPDLIGFGSSKSVLHPYYVEEATADAVRDAVRAARDLASDKQIPFNGKLFLAGYSQGGYATMATHKSIEAEPLDGIDLVASFPSSGGYDIKEMQEYFFGLEEYDQPFYLAFVAQAYKVHYDWSQSLAEFFNEPYATKIPSLVNGSKTNNQINDELTISIEELVTADVLANINTDTKYKYIVDGFNENGLVDWTPTIPMYMYHGDEDITVPYQNSVTTYNKLIANGASASVVTLTTLDGATHNTGIFPYIEHFIPKMLELMK